MNARGDTSMTRQRDGLKPLADHRQRALKGKEPGMLDIKWFLATNKPPHCAGAGVLQRVLRLGMGLILGPEKLDGRKLKRHAKMHHLAAASRIWRSISDFATRRKTSSRIPVVISSHGTRR